MVLCIESCEREITSVAAPVTGHIQKYCGLTGKSKKIEDEQSLKKMVVGLRK